MRPFINEVFNVDAQKQVMLLFDTRSFMFSNLITFKQFQKELQLLKPRGSK